MREEKKRLNNTADASSLRQLAEESKEPTDSSQKDEDGYEPVQPEQMSLEEQLHQGGQGTLQSVKQSNHSIIKEMVEEENE